MKSPFLKLFSSLGGGFLSGSVKSGDKNSVKKLPHAMRVTFGSEENFKRLCRCEEVAAQTGYTLAQIALAWVLAQDMDTYVITGSSKMQSLNNSVAATEIALTAQQLEYLEL